MKKPISGLKFGYVELVFILDACIFVVCFPTFVAPLDPTALFGFKDWRMFVGRFLGCGGVNN